MRQLSVLAALLLAVASAGAQEMRVGDILPTASFRTANPITVVAFSPDSTLLAGGSTDRVQLWSMATGIALPHTVGPRGQVTALAFSPDSKLLAMGTNFPKGAVIVWDIEKKQAQRTYDVAAATTAISFSPDGKWLVTAGEDKKVILWETEKSQRVKLLEGNQLPVTAFSWSADNKVLQAAGGGLGARTSEDDRIGGNTGDVYATLGEYTRWNVDSGRAELNTILANGSSKCTFSPDGKLLVVLGEGVRAQKTGLFAGVQRYLYEWGGRALILWKVGYQATEIKPAGTQIRPKTPALHYSALPYQAPPLAWSGDGSVLVWPGYAANIQTSTVQRINRINVPDADPSRTSFFPPQCYAFSPDGKFLAAGGGTAETSQGGTTNGIQVWGIVQPAAP